MRIAIRIDEATTTKLVDQYQRSRGLYQGWKILLRLVLDGGGLFVDGCEGNNQGYHNAGNEKKVFMGDFYLHGMPFPKTNAMILMA